MTYFADGTPYAYGGGNARPGANIDGGDDDLNVGWLDKDHDFPHGPAPAGFFDALLTCATRPVREYRGFHPCELCDRSVHEARVREVNGRRIYDRDLPVLDGRRIDIGNGEVRVEHAGRWYTAPTLVAHYVATHGYRPPDPFIAGVLARAPQIYVMRGAQLARFRAMDDGARRVVCVRALIDVAAMLGVELGDASIDLLQPISSKDLHRNVSGADPRIRDLAWMAADLADFRDPDPTRRVIATLERAADLGLDVSRY